MKKKLTPLVGAHISIAGGFYKAVERAQAIGCTTMQIFTKNNKAWLGKKITQQEIDDFKKAMRGSGLSKIMVHNSYLINIASKNPDVERKSVSALKHELQRCEQLGIPYLVLHPGSHLGAGEEKGISKISKNLDKALAHANGKTKILLETMAGQGTNLGKTFKELKAIIKGCKYKKLIGVCLDTCHIFSAGYDIGNEKKYDEVIKQFSRTIGISRLKAIHINDSKTECGSHKDRHANLGKGKIPRKAFSLIMKDKRLLKIPKVLETPDTSLYEKEIKSLKRMAGVVKSTKNFSLHLF
jgi:deoxyribonuclease-4